MGAARLPIEFLNFHVAALAILIVEGVAETGSDCARGEGSPAAVAVAIAGVDADHQRRLDVIGLIQAEHRLGDVAKFIHGAIADRGHARNHAHCEQ